MDGITWVGMDVHKKAINVAVFSPTAAAPEEFVIENNTASLRRLAKKLRRDSRDREIRCCYEAGPCGYVVKRQLETLGVICEVIAPSLIPVKPGEKVKTDRRDARKLGELFRGGLLTEVMPPTPEQEAVRDLCRCRADAQQDVLRARHRIAKLLLRRGFIFDGGKRSWTQAHRIWLRAVRLEHGVDQAILDDYTLALSQAEERVKSLDQKIAAEGQKPLFRESVAALRCFRGIDHVAALSILSELHGLERFSSPRKLTAYLGLVPTEYSSSEKTRRGAITKTGNNHVRRMLVEVSWHYRHKPGVGPKLKKRREGQSRHVIGVADKAQQRLHRRYRRLTELGKPANKALVAVTRELVGFIWAALQPAPA